MEKLTIRIKKAANIHAWSNQNIGETVVATYNPSNEKYHVVFSENAHLAGISENALAGFIPACAADII